MLFSFVPHTGSAQTAPCHRRRQGRGHRRAVAAGQQGLYAGCPRACRVSGSPTPVGVKGSGAKPAPVAAIIANGDRASAPARCLAPAAVCDRAGLVAEKLLLRQEFGVLRAAEILDVVRFLKAKATAERCDLALVNESAQGEDWLRPEEEAWRDL